MSAKHTPGPWEVWPNVSTAVRAVTGRHIADMHRLAEGESEANAALIAAAPDLMTALRDLLDARGPCEHGGPSHEEEGRRGVHCRWCRARAALAKAQKEGGQK